MAAGTGVGQTKRFVDTALSLSWLNMASVAELAGGPLETSSKYSPRKIDFVVEIRLLRSVSE